MTDVKLGLNSNSQSGSNVRNCFQCSWDEREEIFDRVAWGTEHHNSQPTLRQVLLKLEILVSRHQNGEPRILSGG